jgi:uncharacterized membrane protein
VRSRLRGWLEGLGDVFWLRPALLVLLGLLLGVVMVWAERAGVTESWVSGGWIYAGGESRARSLLSAVASSTIGVAGTVFSITVAALSLASGQMGPRLLRNFIRDPGNQLALGIFLGTFVYALVLLRTVRSVDEVAFVPHLGITGALVLALLCVGTLVWFVHHIANSINVNTVIGVVHAELSEAVAALEPAGPDGDGLDASTLPEAPGRPVVFGSGGYLRSLDEDALADWAATRGATLWLRVRPGDYLFPGARVGEAVGIEGAATSGPSADAAFAAAASVGATQAAAQDLEFAVRQLVEMAVRALSPGINDPFTAAAVLDRLGATLCEVAGKRLPNPVLRRDGRLALVRQVTDYDGLCDAMFHMIRQNSGGSAMVLIRLVETLQRVEEVERDTRRRTSLCRHIELALATGRSAVEDVAGRADLEERGRKQS